LTKTIQQKVEETAKNLQHEHEEFVKQVNEKVHKPKAGTGSSFGLIYLFIFHNLGTFNPIFNYLYISKS